MIEIRRGRSATVTDLATDYDISTKTFRSWLRRANIQKGTSHYLCPKVIQKIYDHFGVPSKEVA